MGKMAKQDADYLKAGINLYNDPDAAPPDMSGRPMHHWLFERDILPQDALTLCLGDAEVDAEEAQEIMRA